MIIGTIVFSIVAASLMWNLKWSSQDTSLCMCTIYDDEPVYNISEGTIISFVSKSTCLSGTVETDWFIPQKQFIRLRLDNLSAGNCNKNQDKDKTVSGWNEWSSWSSCNTNTQYRERYCNSPENIMLCLGQNRESKKCVKSAKIERFLTDGVFAWSNWHEWSTCPSQTCDKVGVSARRRECLPNNALSDCPGRNIEYVKCLPPECIEPNGWTQWSSWSICNAPCENQVTNRTRQCMNSTAATCFGDHFETRICLTEECVVDGMWSEWTQWSACSKADYNDKDGLVKRLRTCTNPAPANGGQICRGPYWDLTKCEQMYGWAEWGSWGECYHTGEVDIQIRNRTCIRDRNGSDCTSNRYDTKVCQKPGTWEKWSEWGACDATCDEGWKVRIRRCFQVIGNEICSGNNTEKSKCYNGNLCPDSKLTGWSEWGSWTFCNHPCDVGNSTRNRICHDPQSCHGENVEYKRCSVELCAVNGEWSEWEEWSALCVNNFGGNHVYRQRNCTNPIPLNGGTYCHGSSVDIDICKNGSEWGSWESWSDCLQVGASGLQFRNRLCHLGMNNDSCTGLALERQSCKLEGYWSDWSNWTGCSTTCGAGVQTRNRTCSLGYDNLCDGKGNESNPCTLVQNCPIDGRFSEWSPWSDCPVTCAGGVIYRNRLCDQPVPRYGGKSCEGKNTEVDVCNILDCPVDGHWTDWNPWSVCSETCDNGTKTRDRTCTNPRPKNNGSSCSGPALQNETCMEVVCSVDGGWGSWTEWSQCSCNKYHARRRLCNNPAPIGVGAGCIGEAIQNETCSPDTSLLCPVTGGWAEWLEWGTRCSVTCGDGFEHRYRTCTNPKPSHGGSYCPDEFEDSRPCSKSPCPVDGQWTSWSAWSTCDVSCDNGTTFRARACTNPPPKFGGTDCLGSDNETQQCTQRHCPIDGQWSSWSEWSSWDATCENATRSRQRLCDNPKPEYGGHPCDGDYSDHENQEFIKCPIDGQWSDWEVWSKCSVTCETGTKSRIRKCASPAPQYNGANCTGNSTEEDVCVDRVSCKIDGNWANWSPWYDCSVSCGPGTRQRYRSCSNPVPQNGGQKCPGSFSETSDCNVKDCPVDGQWADWGTWGSCSVSCSNGTTTRSRTCSNPLPAHEGKQCVGNFTDETDCFEKYCPVDGGWADWSEWYECSVSCGQGVKLRNRTCTNPAPQYNGTDCSGTALSNDTCIMQHCPINGGWGSWQTWEACSNTCGNGTQTRTRLCNNPTPDYGGANCTGTDSDTGVCMVKYCPVNGGWTVWTPWSPCFSSNTQRFRDCSNPSPNYGGSYCDGEPVEAKSCTTARK